MTDMLEQKNKLAYEKGRLQSKVDQLQKEVEQLAGAHTDSVGLGKMKQALEAKLNKVTIIPQDKKTKCAYCHCMVIWLMVAARNIE